MKNYVKYLLKRYLPFYAVTFAIVIAIFFVYIATPTNYYRYINDSYIGHTPTSGLALFIIPLGLITTIAPLFANSYRYSIKSVDTFYQTGKGDKKIRITNNLTLLASVLAVYTIAFLIAMLVMLFQQISTAGRVVINNNIRDEYIFYNFGFYFLAYFLAVIFSALNYSISYFLVTRANTMMNSIMCLLFGQALLTFLVVTPYWYASAIKELFDGGYPLYALTTQPMLSLIGPFAFLIKEFEHPIIGKGFDSITFDARETFTFVIQIVGLVLFTAIGALTTLFFFKEKESSGELAGKPEGRDKMQMIIFHTAVGLWAFWQGTGRGFFNSIIFLTIISTISSFIMFGALYYVFFGIVRKNFRLEKKDWIIYLSIIGVYVISAIAFGIMTGVAADIASKRPIIYDYIPM